MGSCNNPQAINTQRHLAAPGPLFPAHELGGGVWRGGKETMPFQKVQMSLQPGRLGQGRISRFLLSTTTADEGLLWATYMPILLISLDLIEESIHPLDRGPGLCLGLPRALTWPVASRLLPFTDSLLPAWPPFPGWSPQYALGPQPVWPVKLNLAKLQRSWWCPPSRASRHIHSKIQTPWQTPRGHCDLPRPVLWAHLPHLCPH